jgi:hypothetical protein
MTLPETQNDAFDLLRKAFLARIQPKELWKIRFAKEMFNDKQLADETVDTFIIKLCRKTSDI